MNPFITEMVTIPLSEYLELKTDQKFLRALQEAGVDNWEGCGEAHRAMEYDLEDDMEEP